MSQIDVPVWPPEKSKHVFICEKTVLSNTQSLNSSGMNSASYKRKGGRGGKLQFLRLTRPREKPQREEGVVFVLRQEGRGCQ